jgi:hypothetical protein
MKGTRAIIVILIGLLTGCLHHNRATEAKLLALTPNVPYSFTSLTRDTILFDSPQQVADLSAPDLIEVSGLAASHRNPGYIWMEEDSGNANEIQLVSQEGKIVARYVIDGVKNRDWEDIAVGPGPEPGEVYIYLADIGDNRFWHHEKIIYRFPEPSLNGQKLPYKGHITASEAIHLQLPDGAQNAEAILLDASSQELLLLTKGKQSFVYSASYLSTGPQPTMMTRLFSLPFKDVTSAAVSSDGNEILIRTYEQLFYYQRNAGETITESLKQAPCLLPVATEMQGEAVGWAADGSGYFTASEKLDSNPHGIFFCSRKKPQTTNLAYSYISPSTPSPKRAKSYRTGSLASN